MGESMLSTSAEIGELAKALAAAQGAFPAIKKERTARIEGSKANYSYAYADLSDVMDAVRKPLALNGLAIIQPICLGAEHPWLVTRLMHSSGQWIESAYPLAVYERPQETGSAITYARRYAVTSLLGIAAEEDDDGATANSAERKPDPSKPSCPKCGKQAPVIKGKPEFGGGWVCFTKKNGCGAKWDDTAPPSKATDAPTGEAIVCPHCKSHNIGEASDGAAFCKDCRRGI